MDAIRFARRLSSLLLVPLVVVACADQDAARRQYLERGNEHVRQQRYREGIVEYLNAVKQDPRWGEARLALAEAYVRNNEPARALPQYVRAADLLPGRRDVQLKAAQMLLLAGRFDDAKTRLAAVLQQDPKQTEARILYANALAGLKDLDGAAKEVRDAINLDPESGTSYAALGVLELARGDREKAEAAYKQAIALDPKSLGAHLAFGNYYWATGRNSEAEAEFKTALAIDPANRQLNQVLSMYYLATDRAAEAEAPLKALVASTEDVEPAIALADYYVATRRGAEGVALYEKTARQRDGFAPATIRLAVLARRERRSGDAYRLIDAVLQQEGSHAHAMTIKARWLSADGRMAEGLSLAKAAVAANGRFAPAHYVLGLIQSGSGEPGEAAKSFTEVLKLNPRAAEARMQLSRLQLAEGRSESSVQTASEALQRAPGDPNVRLVLARGLVAQGDWSRAGAMLNELGKEHPGSAAVHVARGVMQLKKGEEAPARASFERALALDADNLEALGHLLSLDAASRRLHESRARFDARLPRLARNPAFLTLAGQAYVAAGDLPKAEGLLRQAIERDPARLRAYASLGALYVQTGRLDRARAEFEQIARRRPKSIGAHTMVAIILQVQNRGKEAQQRYEQILEMDGRAAVAANNLAWIYAEQGVQLDEALKLAQMARAALPDQADVSDTLGWVYYRKQVPRLAVGPFEESVRKDPGNPVYRYHLGLAYAKVGERERARTTLQQALRLSDRFDGADQARATLATLQ